MAGNPNPTGSKPDKLIRDALKAALRQDPAHLKQIAENWIERAKSDQQAATELTNRIDGKAVQPIVGDDEHSPVNVITKMVIDLVRSENPAS